MNCSQTFASDSDYIFFEKSVLQQNKLSDPINMAIKKVWGRITTSMFANYEESVLSQMTKVSY